MPKRTSPTAPASHARYWSHRYTADYLGVSPTTLKRHSKSGLFPRTVAVAVGRKAYLADEVKRWCDQQDAKRTQTLRDAAVASATHSDRRFGAMEHARGRELG